MTDAEIKRIAEGLSEAQRRQMMDIGAGKVMESAMRHGLVSFYLISEGLLTFSRTWWLWGEYVFYLTPLGLAVRDYLEKSDG
jgi:hypothetical protein